MAPPLHMTPQYCLASMAAQLSSKGVRHHNLLPHIPSGHLPTVNDRPHSANALQFLSSSSQMPCVPGDLHPCLGYGGLQQGLSLWFLPHSNCHRSVAALYNSPTLFPFVLNNCCAIGVWPLLQFPHPPGFRSSPAHSPLFPFLHPTKFCVHLYIPFQWSVTPAKS